MSDNLVVTGIEFDARKTAREIERLDRMLAQLEGRFNASERAASKNQREIDALSGKILKLAAAYGAFRALENTADFIFRTNVEFQKLEAQLIAVEGSTGRAERAFDLITQFASTTPFEVQNLTEAFVQLRVRGADPTIDRLRGLGNFAAAFAKDITDVTDAIISGAAGQTESLRRIGLDAKREGDQITLSFQGVTKTVRGTAEQISKFISDIGEARFGDAMAERMNKLDGAISNLKDSSALLAKEIGEAGLNGEINKLVRRLDTAIKDGDEFAKVLGENAAKGVRLAGDAAFFLAEHMDVIITGFEVLAGIAIAQGIAKLTQGVWGLATAMTAVGAANPATLIVTLAGAIGGPLLIKLLTAGDAARALNTELTRLGKNSGAILSQVLAKDDEVKALEAKRAMVGLDPNLDGASLERQILQRKAELQAIRSVWTKTLNEEMGGGGTSTTTATSSDDFDKLIAGLREQQIELDKGKRAAFEYRLEMAKFTPGQREAALKLFDAIEALEKKQETEKEATETAKRNAEAIQNTLAQLKEQNIELLEGEEALLRYALAQKGASEADIQRAIALHKSNAAARKAREDTERDREQREREEIARFEAQQNQLQQSADRMAAAITDPLQDVMTQTENVVDAFHNMVDGIINEIIRLTLHKTIAEPFAQFLAAALSSTFSGVPSSGDIDKLITRNLAGARALGGPVERGSAYLVGERGPEVFVPRISGSIVPNGRLGGSTIVIHEAPLQFSIQAIDARGVADLFEQNGPLIAKKVLEAKNSSAAFAAALKR